MSDSSFLSQKIQQASSVHDFADIRSLRESISKDDKKSLHQAAEKFEAIFVQMMLKSMRKAQDVLADENNPMNSEQTKFYRDMHDQQLSAELAGGGGLGLAKLIVQQLGGDTENFAPASSLRNDGNLSSSKKDKAVATYMKLK